MNVDLFATLRQIAGRKTVEIDVASGATVRAAVAALVEQFPPIGPELFDGAGELHPHVHVFVDGRDVHYLEGGLDARLPVDAKLDVFPAVGGG